MVDLFKVRDDFNALLDDKGVSYQQNLYWTARWNGTTPEVVKEVLMGPMKPILNDTIELNRD